MTTDHLSPRSIAATLAVLLAVVSAAARAQEPAAPPTAPVVSAVEFRRHNVYDSAEARGWLKSLGNSLHRTTHPDIITRELLIQPGERYDSALAAESARNLRALGTFRGVAIDTVRGDSGLILRVETRDGWSTRPEISFTSAGTQTALTLGVVEQNFLGRAAVVGARYRDDPDRSSGAVWFTQRRAFARTFGVRLRVEGRSDGWTGLAAVARPFLTTSSRAAAEVSLLAFAGDVLRFREGNPSPAEVLRRRLALARATGVIAVRASPRGYVRLGVAAHLRRDDFVPAGASESPRTITGTVGVSAEASHARFRVVDHFRSLGRVEDVDLSPTVRAVLLAAPAAFGYRRGGVGAELSVRGGVPIGRGFLATSIAANGLYASDGLDSGRVAVAGTLLLRPVPSVALIARGEGGWQRTPTPGEEFDLGLGRGLRAHRAHAFTGDRTLSAMAEVRWSVAHDAARLVDVAIAAFGARGGAWYHGSRHRFGSEAGIGLRIGPSRMADGTVVRIDLARRFATDRLPGGWTLVIGEGLPM